MREARTTESAPGVIPGCLESLSGRDPPAFWLSPLKAADPRVRCDKREDSGAVPIKAEPHQE